MTIKYYADPGSGSCRRVSAVIKYLNIEVEEIFIDLLAGKNRSAAFLQINPTGMVPVMVIEDDEHKKITISEASAIMIYLCEQVGETDLYPNNQSRIQINKWMFWAAEHFRQAAPIYFEEKVIAPLIGNTSNTHRIEEADKLIETHASILNEHLKDRRFVVSDHVTLADFDLAAALSQMPRTKNTLREIFPHHGVERIFRKPCRRVEDHGKQPKQTNGYRIESNLTHVVSKPEDKGRIK